MASPTIRPAEPPDYDRIAAVMDDWWGRPVRAVLPRLFLDHFAATSLVAEDPARTTDPGGATDPGGIEDTGRTGGAGVLAGFLVGFLSPSRPREAYIHFAGVSPRYRRAGLARRLYARFFELARADGRRIVRAITPPQNDVSIAFHSSLGFTVTGPVRDYHGPGADRVLFERRLDGPGAGRVLSGRRRLDDAAGPAPDGPVPRGPAPGGPSAGRASGQLSRGLG